MWATVLEWVGKVFIILYAIITTIIAFKKKTYKGESFSILDIINYIGDAIEHVEIYVSNFQKEEFKTGALKKKLVLQDIEHFCKQNSIVFDEQYFGDIIDRLVAIMNVKDSTKAVIVEENITEKEEVHSNGQETNKATFSFIKK